MRFWAVLFYYAVKDVFCLLEEGGVGNEAATKSVEVGGVVVFEYWVYLEIAFEEFFLLFLDIGRG